MGVISGSSSSEKIAGTSSNDRISGFEGDDTIIGAAGIDTLIGGTGNDIYYVDNVKDIVTEDASEGTDTVISSVTYTIGANIENLTLSGSSNIHGKGNDLDNKLIGNSGSNILDGKVGSDTMLGAAGNDIYCIDSTGDVVTENSNQGTDTLASFIDYTIGANIEHLILAGGSSSINGTGNALNNSIAGNTGDNTLDGDDGNDTLNGGDGVDTMIGGTGNDIYYVNKYNDVITENNSEGTDTVYSSVSYTLSSNVENLVISGKSNLSGTGSSDNNKIIGNSGSNIIDGKTGTDTMAGGAGNDTYYVDDSNDITTEVYNQGIDTAIASASYTLSVNLENLTLSDSADISGAGNALNNKITGNSGDNTLTGAAGNDTLIGGAGADAMTGGIGDDIYYIDDTGDTVTEIASQGTDSVISSIAFTLDANIENLAFSGSTDINALGNTLNNKITGNSGNNTIDGSTGTDTMYGGAGNDIYYVDNSFDLVSEGLNQGTDLVIATASYALGLNIENLTFSGVADIKGVGNTSNNTIIGNAGNNTIDGKAGTDSMIGGTGNDIYYVDNSLDVITENNGEGTDSVYSLASFTLSDNIENLTLQGALNVNGIGNTLDNKIIGNNGNNTLNGASGEDTMTGAVGDDTYYIDNTGDIVTENTNQGTDTVISSITYTLGANLENLALSGSNDIKAEGNTLNNKITGNSGNNTIDGSTGTDTMIGGAGDDIYYVDNSTDLISESSTQGTDSVFSTASYVLTSNIENLTLSGSSNINAIGNTLNNTITGNSGNNAIDGKTGTDSMVGGAGNDTYYVDNTSDVTIENSGEGTDSVYSSVSYTLSDNIENLTLTSSLNISGVGNALDNKITGNNGNNTLNGDIGSDTMTGGSGDDAYYVDNTGDLVTENLNQGNDIVVSSISYTIGSNIENLTLSGNNDIKGIGNTINNKIAGNSGDNTIDGGIGSDVMTGGLGDDIYYVDNSGDIIVEKTDEGIDTVNSTVNYLLVDNVENLILTGTSNINATGNKLDNSITGNSGNNVINGGIGADTMIGGAGNDTYYVDDSNDEITENNNEGIDIVYSSASFTIGNNIETLILTGSSSVDGIGNTLNNTLTGNSASNLLDGDDGNDTINGGAGSDSMIGGLGDDIYYVDNSNDDITENTTEGFDIVYATASFTLSDNIENLILTGTSNINGSGNDLDNTITGNSGNNIIDGGTGIDTMIGGAGNDTYYVDNISDVIVESSNQGTDKIEASIDYTISTNIENLALIGSNNITGQGNSYNNIIIGNDGNNTLAGDTGTDTLKGGIGDDTYYVNSNGDLITENADEGADTVYSSITFSLMANVDNLILSDTSNINGTGNDIANTITGNSGNNTLDGKGGADALIGDDGDDTYYVDDSNDIITENADEGLDIVYASASFTLGDNIEDAILTGTSAISFTGNTLNNSITGNNSNNIIDGGDGNDTIIGSQGIDTLIGGIGDDTYYIDASLDQITENADEGSDVVYATASYTLSDGIEDLILSGSSSLSGTGNALNNSITANSANNTLNGGSGDDTLIGGLGNDTYIIDSTADVITEESDEGTDTVKTYFSYTIDDNLENMALLGTDDINGTGNSFDNIITGNSGNNSLDGDIGADTLIGGAGDDNYCIDDAGDLITENAAQGTDTAYVSISYTLGNNIENIILSGSNDIDLLANSSNNSITGNTGDNIISGGAGNDTIDGAGGTDVLNGGLGNDTYIVDFSGCSISENNNEGIDTVYSSVSMALGENIEVIILTGTDDINLSANSSNNTITSNTGTDNLSGGLGDDTYYINNANDLITENIDEGTDTVYISESYTVGDNIENIILSGTDDINATGNEINNIITGNDGSNIINGGAGSDTLTGGLGDDSYYIDNTGDVITENNGEGTDTVYSSISYTLSNNFENLTLTDSGDIEATGNDLNNTITGNNGNNIIDGATGDDTLLGGLGNDTYYINGTNDFVTENSDEGIDLINTSISYTLGSNIENLTLLNNTNIDATGNDLNNTITGNNGNNIIDGATGADTMIGASGNDTYYVDDSNDVITENNNEGIDIVYSSASFTLGDNIENITLLGASNLNSTGNDINNVITGNIGNNILDGGSGADTMVGELGDDTYYVDDSNDVITENNGEGTDIVNASTSYTLSNNIETLTLTGVNNTDATGNAINNTIIGNDGDNIISGGNGDDTLTGNAGNDTYVFLNNNGMDVIDETTSASSDGIKFADNNVLASNIALYIDGQSNLIIDYGAIVNQALITVNSQTNNIYAPSSIEKIELNNGLFITNDDINQIIQSINSYATDHSIQINGVSDIKSNTDLMNIISTSWHS